MDLDVRIARLPGARWIPMATSVAFLGATILAVAVGPGTLLQRSVAALLPGLLSVRLIAHARDLEVADQPERLGTILGWTAGGIAVTGLVALWFWFVAVGLDVAILPGIATLTILAAGALLGVLVGRYGLRAREQASATTRERVQRELTRRQQERITLLNRILRHHTRNAVNVVVLNAEALAPRVDEESEEFVESIHAEAMELSATVDVIGDVAETLAEVRELRGRDAVPVLERELDDAREEYPRAEFVVDPLPEEATVLADDLLGRVIGAQLENAVEHSDRESPTVEVALDDGPETVRLRIADDGPGIPDEEKSIVFEAGDRGQTTEGDGLDLFLVDALVDRYGGSVTVEDNEPRGAVFVTTLPKPGVDPERRTGDATDVDTNPAMILD